MGNKYTSLRQNVSAEAIPLTPMVPPPRNSNPGGEAAHSGQRTKTLTRRWFKGVMICTCVLSVLVMNTLFTIIAAVVAYSKEKAHGLGYAPLYQGQCSVAKKWTTGIHLVINILSTVILGASNYCLQWLSAPSRSEVDKAHAKRVWLSIGVSSIVDLLVHGQGRRRYLAFILLLTSLPFHLIYNSAIYYSVSPAEYPVVITEADRPIWTALPTPSHGRDEEECVRGNLGTTMSSFLANKEYQYMSGQECFNHFANDYVFGNRALFLMTNQSISGAYPAVYVDVGGRATYYENKNNNAFGWMCSETPSCRKGIEARYIPGSWTIAGVPWSSGVKFELHLDTRHGPQALYGDDLRPGYILDNTADTRQLWDLLSQEPYTENLRSHLDNASLWQDSIWAADIQIVRRHLQCGSNDFGLTRIFYSIDHCLAVPTEETCQLIFSPVISLVVVGCSAIKLICVFLTARDDRDEIFLTVGDAISSFLKQPDPYTEGVCLLSKTAVTRGVYGWRKVGYRRRSDYTPGLHPGAPEHLPKRKLFMHAISWQRWFTTMLICATILGASGFLLHMAIEDFKEYGSGNMWTSGLGGTKTSTTLISGLFRPRTTNTIFAIILLANTPQLLLSVAYFQYNALLTGMLAASEYNDYAVDRKPLRVSWPTGAQRWTYYHSLPYRYSFPLLTASALLHWLVSQSFYFVEIMPNPVFDYVDGVINVVTCGYSPAAIIYAIITGSVLVIAAVVLGLRRFPTPMPLAAQCSAAISAACHPLKEYDHALKPVQWGEVQLQGPAQGGDWTDTSRVFHCSFTSDEVNEPMKERLYL